MALLERLSSILQQPAHLAIAVGLRPGLLPQLSLFWVSIAKHGLSCSIFHLIALPEDTQKGVLLLFSSVLPVLKSALKNKITVLVRLRTWLGLLYIKFPQGVKLLLERGVGKRKL